MDKNIRDNKEEILNAAERLFLTKGYEKTTVNNILAEVGIAKGTFYYYFDSKEEVLDAVIHRVSETLTDQAQIISENPNLSPIEKFVQVILALQVQNDMGDAFKEILHEPENALSHQKTLVEMVSKVTPILERVVLEGVNKGVFSSIYTKEYIQIFLTSTATLLDDGIFQLNVEEQKRMLLALAALLDKMFGVLEGSFWEVIKEYYG